ncbi:diguanylate cyclase [Paenibacillus chartarius]|uniref:Diguanylate cyclase n=1 Tax=Paenibacillus chartarius TaxID=747481 RepID=A0ABV6DER1_9BACL
MISIDLQSGRAAPLISDLVVLVILSLMLVIAVRLWVDRRKKAYRSLAWSIGIIMAQYALQLYLHSSAQPSETIAYWTLLLRTVSFLLVNMSIFQLYNPTRAKHRIMMTMFLLGAGAVSLLHIYMPSLFQGTDAQVRMLQGLGMDLYLFVLIFLSFNLISPFIAQTGKYQAAMTIYFTEHVAHVLNRYVFGDAQPFLSLLKAVLPVVFYFILFIFLFERVVEIMQAIYNTSITDGLTRLYNRKFFDKRVSQYVQHGYPVSVLFSDIDNFKKLNDTKGHHMGDEVLKQVAEILKQESEECGVAGRYGGEEMVLLITDPTIDMDQFAEKIRSRIEAETIVTASIGYSKYKSGISPNELIRQADEAMYKAKTSGKNKVVSYG